MTGTLLEIINLFFIPMVALAIHEKTVKSAACKRNLIMAYGIYTAMVLTATRGIMYTIYLIRGTHIAIKSGIYALIALIVAMMLPWLFVLFRKFFSVTFEVKKNEKA